MTAIYIAGVGMTKFTRHLERSYKDLTREAVEAALGDAGAATSDVREAFFGSCVLGHLQGQHMIPGQVALQENGGGVFGVEEATAVVNILLAEPG